MKILSAAEQESFDKPPVFNGEERKKFFDITAGLLNTVNDLRKPAYKIGFIVACGYFRATKKFFAIDDCNLQDIEYVSSKLGIQNSKYSSKNYPRSRIHNHRKIILNLYGYHNFDADAESYIKQEITDMVRVQLKPKLIFWRCVDLLTKIHVSLPSCYQLSELILMVLNRRKQEMVDIIDQELSQNTRAVLDELLVQKHSDDTQYSRYKLTLLKKLSQSTKPSKVKERVDDLFYLKELYGHLETIIPQLKLGNDGIRYYANSVIKADIFQLHQRSNEDRYIHLIAFIAHQYYRLQDNLADVLLTVMQSYQNSSTREHRDLCYENYKQREQSFKSLSILGDNALNIFTNIDEALKSQNMTDAEKIEQIRALLPQEVIDESEEFKSSSKKIADDRSYFEILENRSIRLQNRISQIVKSLDFQGEYGTAELFEAISYFKEKDGNITKHAPLGFLDVGQQNAINDGGTFHTSLYKVFLFTHIASALKSGRLNLKHSYKYRTLDDYMISKKRWGKEKNELLERAELKEFIDPAPLLETLDKALYLQYQTTNKYYLDGNNQHLKIKDNGIFTIATPKQEERQGDSTLQSFFPEQPVPLTEILSTVNRHSGFLEEFEHWQQRYTKNSATDKALYAGIIGKGCAIGTPKIARISNQINENNLSHVINWYFSLENIRAANDRVIKLMDYMELPEIYRKSKDAIHTASDGQKFTLWTDSLNANYSFKYCGKEQGVSVYTFVDERNLLWHSTVISAAERESHYVIDGLMRNDVVKSDIHSTDTHGYSETIFAVMHLLGFSFAPRIKNLKKQTLYTFKSHKKSDHPEWQIRPDKYINEEIIKETWDDILRLVATIKLKETTASEIFNRLNSYSKQHRLYQGLKAFGQIIKSQFILQYLDDVELRQAIEKQLNNVELTNRFTRAVAVGDPRGYSQGEKEDQEISESCNRLIKNTIICWNYLYLSDKLTRLEKHPEQRQILLSSITRHSVMSWAHINMLGEYDFSDEKLQDSFGIRPPKLVA